MLQVGRAQHFTQFSNGARSEYALRILKQLGHAFSDAIVIAFHCGPPRSSAVLRGERHAQIPGSSNATLRQCQPCIVPAGPAQMTPGLSRFSATSSGGMIPIVLKRAVRINAPSHRRVYQPGDCPKCADDCPLAGADVLLCKYYRLLPAASSSRTRSHSSGGNSCSNVSSRKPRALKGPRVSRSA